MEPTNAPESNATVVHGAFEQAWSLKELAGRLQVNCQTIYDLRSQGRGPTGFRIGRELPAPLTTNQVPPGHGMPPVVNGEAASPGAPPTAL